MADVLLNLLISGDEKALDNVVEEVITKLPGGSLFAVFPYLLELLSQEEKMLKPPQRLVGFAILQQAYASQQPSSSPYISFLIDAACDERAEGYERSFILQLLGSTTDGDVLKQSAADFIQNYKPPKAGFPSREELQQRYVSVDISGVREHIPEVRELISIALKRPLELAYEKQVLEGLKKDPKFVNECGLTPLKLPGLVENNPGIAVEVLIQLANSPEKLEYFTVLVGMDMSICSMEVVSSLTTAVEIPSECIQIFITNCTSSCQKCKEKPMQTILVRLLCVFLRSLIRNNTVNVKNLLTEVEVFCLKFKHVKEAAGLLRLLKALS